MKFETVLMAHDGSENAWRALPVAAQLARQSRGRVVVAHVREWMNPPMPAPGGLLPPVDLISDEDADALEEQALKNLADAGVPATFERRRAMRGQAAPAILDMARETHAELIVMGTRGLGDLKALLVGSVTHGVLHRSSIPVLIVP